LENLKNNTENASENTGSQNTLSELKDRFNPEQAQEAKQ